MYNLLSFWLIFLFFHWTGSSEKIALVIPSTDQEPDYYDSEDSQCVLNEKQDPSALLDAGIEDGANKNIQNKQVHLPSPNVNVNGQQHCDNEREETHWASQSKHVTLNMSDAGLADITEIKNETVQYQMPSPNAINNDQPPGECDREGTRCVSNQTQVPWEQLSIDMVDIVTENIENNQLPCKIAAHLNKKHISNEVLEEEGSAVDGIELEMEVFNMPTPSYQETSDVLCNEFPERNKATESGVSLTGKERSMETGIGHTMIRDTTYYQYSCTTKSIETTGSNENLTKESQVTGDYNRCLYPIEQKECQSVQNPTVVSNSADLASSYRGNGEIEAMLQSPVSADYRTSKACKDKDVEKQTDVQTDKGTVMDLQANFAPNSPLNTTHLPNADSNQEPAIKNDAVEGKTLEYLWKRDKQMPLLYDSKQAKDTNSKAMKLNKSETMVVGAHLRSRDSGKRKLKPTWKLNDYLSSDVCLKKIKQTYETSKQKCNEVNRETEDGVSRETEAIVENTMFLSTPKKNGSPLKVRPKSMSSEVQKKITMNQKMFQILERLRKHHGKTFSSSKPLHFVDEDDCRFVYYLLPKEKMTTVSVRKKETVVNHRKELQLEDYPQSNCIETYTDLAPESRHKSANEKQCQRFLCKICNLYRTVLMENLRQHIELHVNDKLNCRICSFIAHSKHSLRQHMKEVHKNPGNVVCEICGSCVSCYKSHVSKAHGIAAYKCSHCHKAFIKDNERKEHMLHEHKGSVLQCDKCNEIFFLKSSLENHLPKCGENLHPCKYCDKYFPKRGLIAHIKGVHAKQRTHKCNICSFTAASKQQLKAHMNAHLNIHPYACELCKFSCVKEYQLNSHMRTHSGEKKFKCDKCSYAAAWNVQLKSHMKSHLSETQCLCKMCNIVVKDQRCLKLHKRREHKNASD